MAKRVLAVDDDPFVLGLLEAVLGLGGYRVATARARDQAIEQILAARPDMLILDLVLEAPDSGWAILEEVRRDPAVAATPVILCTADTSVSRLQKAYRSPIAGLHLRSLM